MELWRTRRGSSSSSLSEEAKHKLAVGLWYVSRDCQLIDYKYNIEGEPEGSRLTIARSDSTGRTFCLFYSGLKLYVSVWLFQSYGEAIAATNKCRKVPTTGTKIDNFHETLEGRRAMKEAGYE